MHIDTRLDDIRHDIRHTVRQFRGAPGFTAIAALTLALGIGATTAIFSAVYAVVLRPLPFDEPDHLVRIYATSSTTTQSDEVSPRVFGAWLRQNRSFERIAAVETRAFTFAADGGEPRQATGIRTTADYFPMLGVAPLHGRTFVADEDRRGNDRVAVLSHRFWVSRFAGQTSTIGRLVHLDGLPYTIIGVMPASFDVSSGQIDLWTPIALTQEAEATDATGYLDVIARRRVDVSVTQAQADLSAITRRIDATAAAAARGARVVAYEADLVGTHRGRFYILLGAVGLVLLIACANVTNLLLARGAGRAKEFAIRVALGAGRRRVVRQLLTENIVLSVLGGVGGLALAFGALTALKVAGPEGVPRLDQARIDAAALLFALVTSIVSALASGLVPALRAASHDLHSVLKEAGRSSSGPVREHTRGALVALEVAFSLVLLVGAGLLIRSGIMLQRVDPGLAPANVWSGAISLPPADYTTPERITQTFERVVDGVTRIPGVSSAAIISVVPFTGLRALGLFVPEGRPIDDRNMLMANFRHASPGVFLALGIPVRDGRDFSASDVGSSPLVAIVNEAFARLAWPGERAIGKRLLGPEGGPSSREYREVIAVVGATREDGLRDERRPAVYYPIRQVSASLWDAAQGSSFLVARTTVDALSITRSVQAVVTGIDRGVPVYDVRSIEQRMLKMSATTRFNTQLLAALGLVGLLVAAIGIYGVIVYFVGQRRHEIGVRVALGATPARVVALVISQGMRPVLAGLALGSVAAVAVTRVLASQLYGVTPTDPMTFAAVVVTLACIALIAAGVPASSAARVDPRTALGG